MKRLTLLILLISTICNAQDKSSETTNKMVDSFVAKRMNDFQIPGLALAVIKDGKITKLKGYGVANLETMTPVTDESIFMIASLSKQFIATAILLLQQEQKLSIEDKVSKYLDSLPESWHQITLKQLLIHTSGLVRDPLDYQPYVKQEPMEVIKAMFDIPLHATPGESWLYSNAGYYILAEVITRVSGQKWDDFIADDIFKPAGLTTMRVCSTEAIVPNRVDGYHMEQDQRINAENWIAVRPSGAFLASTRDMAKWELFLENGNLLNNSNYILLWTQNQLNNGEIVEYGLGWYIHKFLDRTRIHHDGQYPGFRTDYERFTDDKLTVIVLANNDNRDVSSIAIKVAGFYDTDLATPKFKIEVEKLKSEVNLIKETQIDVFATVLDKNTTNCIVEIEIWDENGKPVFKQQKYNEPFNQSIRKKLSFKWTPEEKGSYTINLGIYGPGWSPSYSWSVGLASIKVK